MTLLFTSYVCDYCDGLASDVTYYSGFVVCEDLQRFWGRPHYVFRTRHDADRWRQARQIPNAQIIEVLSEHEIPWRKSNGAIKGVELARKLFEIYPDRRFEPGPYRAFVAPEQITIMP